MNLKLSAFIATAAVLLVMVAPASASGNLIVNGDFENGNSYWSTHNQPTTTVEVETNPTYDSYYALPNQQLPAGQFPGIYQQVTVGMNHGVVYLSVWAVRPADIKLVIFSSVVTTAYYSNQLSQTNCTDTTVDSGLGENWYLCTMQFTYFGQGYDDGSLTVTFRATSTQTEPNYKAIDNVVVTFTASPTPEPTATSAPTPTPTPAPTPTPEPGMFQPGDGEEFIFPGGPSLSNIGVDIPLPGPLPLPPAIEGIPLDVDYLWDLNNVSDFVSTVITVPVLVAQYNIVQTVLLASGIVFTMRWWMGGQKRTGGAEAKETNRPRQRNARGAWRW